jgi:soluble P-type ATPase
MKIAIPGREPIELNHLVLDFNGTLAVDGVLIDGVRFLLQNLSAQLHVHVITADTFGSVDLAMEGIACQVYVIDPYDQDKQKEGYVNNLGRNHVIAIGNGRNDILMLQTAAIGIALIQKEGAYAPLITIADVLCLSIVDALELLLNPLRLKATLRN